MKTIIYKELTLELLTEWEILWKECAYASFVNSPNWLRVLLDTYKYKNYRIVAVYKDKKLVAIGALIKQKKYGISAYSIPPGDFVCGFPFLVNLEDTQAVSALLKKMQELGNIIIDNVPAEFVTVMNRSIKNADAIPYSQNYFIHLYSDKLGQIKLSNKAKLLNRIRGIEDKFTFKSFAGNEDGINIAFQIDKKSRKEKRGYGTFSDRNIRKLFRNLTKYFTENFNVNVVFYENEPIAYEMGFDIQGIYYGNQIAFHRGFSQYAPGKILVAKLIEHLRLKNTKVLDLGSGESSLKRMLTDEYRILYKVIISKNIFIRTYIKSIYNGKNMLFNLLTKNVAVYSSYKSMRKILKI